MYSKIVGKKSSPCPRAYSSISTCIAASSGGKLVVSAVAIFNHTSEPGRPRPRENPSDTTPPPPPQNATPSTHESRRKVEATQAPFANEQAESLPHHPAPSGELPNAQRGQETRLAADWRSFIFP